MAITYNPFISEYGFKSTGFSVDNEGNLVAKSLSLLTDADSSNFVVSNIGTQFTINEDINPDITIERGSTFTFSLQLTAELDFNIFSANGVYFNQGLTFEDNFGVFLEERDAQGQRVGTLTFQVPVDTPDTLYYADSTFTYVGTINVEFPTVVGIGQFEQLNVTGSSSLQRTVINETTNSTDSNTGSLIIKGGVGIKKDLNIAGSITGSKYIQSVSLVSQSLETDIIDSLTDLTINAGDSMDIRIASTNIATIDSEGLSTSIVNSSINSTVIGDETPSSATFSTAKVNSAPNNIKDITNKEYVDEQATILAIALGV